MAPFPLLHQQKLMLPALPLSTLRLVPNSSFRLRHQSKGTYVINGILAIRKLRKCFGFRDSTENAHDTEFEHNSQDPLCISH